MQTREVWRLEIAILAILALLLVDALDSFQIPSGADQRGRALTGRLLGEVSDLGRRNGQDEIAVALITEGTMAAWETGPPPPYQRQADLILRLAAAKPKAILFDFLYTFPRETEAERAYLGFAIETARASGVPVFLGPVADRAEFAPLAAAGQVDLGFQMEAQDDYALRGVTGKPTAAAALFATWCARTPQACDPAFAEQIAAGEAPSLSLQWRPRAPAALRFFWPPEELETCAFAAEDWAERVRTTFWLIVREATRGLRAEKDLSQTACFPHLAAPAGLLMSDQVDDALLAEFASDRIVLVGSAYRGSADETLAPGYGRIPGVFQHAMALDNLITFGPDYRRQPPEIIYELGWDDLLESILSILLLAFGSWAIHRIMAQAPQPLEPLLDSGAWRVRVVRPALALYLFSAVAVLGPFAAGYVASTVFMWAPANSIGVVIAVFGVGALVIPRGAVAYLRECGVLGPLLWGLAAMTAIGIAGAAAISAFAPRSDILFAAAAAGMIAMFSAAAGASVVALRRPRARKSQESAT